MGGDRRHGSEGEQAQRAHAASVERGTGSWNGAIAGEGPDANRGALGKKAHDVRRRLEDVGPRDVVAAMDRRKSAKQILLGKKVTVEEDRSETEGLTRMPLETESALDSAFRDDAVRYEKLADPRHCGILCLAKASPASLFPV